MSNLNPYQSPATLAVPSPGSDSATRPSFANVTRSTVAVLFAHGGTLAAVVLLICLPWELAVGYIDYFVATEEDQTWPIVMMLLGPLTIVPLAEGIMIAATRDHLLSLQGGVMSAFGRGLRNYPWLLLWIIASNIVIGIGTAICILPGIYLNIRWMYVSAAVVFADPGGRTPLDVSWDLTNRHFNFSALVFFGFCIPMVLLIVLPALLPEISPTLQHWLIETIIALFGDVMLLIVTCAFACTFHQLQQVDAAAESPFTA